MEWCKSALLLLTVVLAQCSLGRSQNPKLRAGSGVRRAGAGSAAVSWPELSAHPAWAALDRLECGESVTDRIIGGSDAALGQFPWLVRLGYTSTEDDSLDWLCGGVLISELHVLTAAHCINSGEDYVLTKVRVGELDASSDPDCRGGVCAPRVQDVRVLRVFQHDQFNRPPFHNDIAVILLESKVMLNEYVAPICLPREGQLSPPQVGELLTVAGWGKTNMTTEQRADVLQMLQIPLLQPSTCNTLAKSFSITPGELCAGAQQYRDACGGDSGGPLMKVFDTPDGPKSVVVGVVSFGPTMCGIKKPGVYSSVVYFLKWILDQVMTTA